mgnify:FL=1
MPVPLDRFAGAQDFAKALADPSFRYGATADSVAMAVSGTWKRVAVAASAASASLAAALAFVLLRPEPSLPVERFSLLPVAGQVTDYDFALSDDGASLVFQRQEDGTSHLALRRFDNLEAAPIPGTEDGFSPDVSPDGTEVAFVSPPELKVTPLLGGVTRTVADSAFCCTRWGEDGYIYFSDLGRAIKRVPAQGGAVEAVTSRTEQDDGPHGEFQVLPGGDTGVFTVWGSPFRIDVLRLSTGERRTVTPGVRPFLTQDGDLVFSTIDGQILAAPFDADALALAGPAVPFVEGVRVDGDSYPFYALSPSGTLAYWTGVAGGAGSAELVWVTRTGEVTPVDPGWEFNPGASEVAVALSPDGRRAAVKIDTEAGEDIWVKQLDAGPLSRLTFDPGLDRRPRWSKDGRSIIFTSDRLGDGYDLWIQPADGTGAPRVLLDLKEAILEVDQPPDESMFVLRLGGLAGATGVRDLVGLRAGDSITAPLAAEPYDEKAAALSPDGRWLAYESTETGRDEIYVRPFPDVNNGKWQVSSQGGINPRWARNGREIFYINGDGSMVAATVSGTGGFEVTGSQPLFSVNDRNLSNGANYASWDVAGDGRFLMIRTGGSDDEGVPNEFVLVQNWLEEVRARLRR